jgi:hypothetical protein
MTLESMAKHLDGFMESSLGFNYFWKPDSIESDTENETED